jgi:hypothetical protein
VLTFNFTEKRQFAAKTERKSVFLGHEVHEVFDFIEKRQLGTKIDRNSIFLGRETHIPDQLYIMVLLISFLWILKNLNFGSKSKGVSLHFYREMLVCYKI